MLINESRIFMKKPLLYVTVSSLAIILLGACGGNSSESETTVPFDDMLSAVSTSFASSGTLRYELFDKNKASLGYQESTIQVKVSDGKYYQTENGQISGYYEAYASKSSDNYLQFDSIDKDNRVISTKQDSLWDEGGYVNPFKATASSEYKQDETNLAVYAFNGSASKVADFANVFLGYDVELKSVYLTTDASSITNIAMETDLTYDEDTEIYSKYIASFLITGIASTIAPSPASYPTKAEHQNLRQAFETLRINQNYTVSDVISDSVSGETTTNYKVNPDVVVINDVDGIKNNASTGCYGFHSISGAVYKNARYPSDSVSSFVPTFTLSPEVFEVVDAKTFKLHYGVSDAINELSFSSSSLTYSVLESAEIKLNDSYQIESLTVKFYSLFSGESQFIDTFSNIDQTTISGLNFTEARNAQTWQEDSTSIDEDLVKVLGEGYALPYQFVDCGWISWQYDSDKNYLNIGSHGYTGDLDALITSYGTLLISGGYAKDDATDLTDYTRYSKDGKYVYVGKFGTDIDLYVSANLLGN